MPSLPMTCVYVEPNTAAKGNRSLRLNTAKSNSYRPDEAISGFQLRTPSLHKNYFLVNDFEDYENYWGDSLHGLGKLDLSTSESQWYNGQSVFLGQTYSFAKEYTTSQDLSSYSAASVYMKSFYDVNLSIAFIDSDGVASPWNRFGKLNRQWRRHDATMSWKYCNSSSIKIIMFREYSTPYAIYHMDELLFYEANESTRLDSWINLLAYDMTTEETGNFGVSDICGGYGGIIHNSAPDSMRATVKYKTNFADMDEDIRWLDICRRNKTPLWLRAGENATKIVVTKVNERPEEGKWGIRNDCSFDCIEV